MTPAQVLASYHSNRTSNVETTRSKDPRMSHPSTWKPRTRIEALLLRPFLAMLVEALIEREIWTFMKTQGLPGIPLHPELRNCPAPSAPRILEILNDVKRHHLGSGGQIRTDLPAPAHPAATAGPRPPTHPSEHLQLTQSGGHIDIEKCGTSVLTVVVSGFYFATDGQNFVRTLATGMTPRRQKILVTVINITTAKAGGYVVSKIVLARLSIVFHGIFFALIGVP